MRQIVVHRAGGYGELRVEDRPDPAPGPGEVRVRVRAIGVNYADCVVRMGLYASAKQYVGWPITPGFEVAGEVDAVGAGVVGVAKGARVIALTRFGAYAEAIVAPAQQLAPMPAGWSFERAASFPVVHLTAWYALSRLCRLEPGARVLVHSAAGGVGGALVQLARIAGVRVAGVVGAAHKVAAAHQLGCELVIDKSHEPLWSAAERFAPDGFDAVFDANGPETLRASYRHLAPEGRLVVYGFHGILPRRGGKPRWLPLLVGWLRTPRFEPFGLVEQNRSVLGFNLSFLFHRGELMRAGLEELLGQAAADRIAPVRIETFPFAHVAEAHAALESGRTVGKLVLVTESF